MLQISNLLHAIMANRDCLDTKAMNGSELWTGGFPIITGPIHKIRSRSPVIVLDVENLSASARQLGGEFDYFKLATVFRAAGKTPKIHAVFSRNQTDIRWISYFKSCGITPHPRDVKTVTKGGIAKRTMNSDVSLAVVCGMVLRDRVSDVIIGTGDGELGTEIAETIRNLSPRTQVASLGVPGSISSRLQAHRNPYVSNNLRAGVDVLSKDVLGTAREYSHQPMQIFAAA